jgi:hypothetical protein
MGNAAPAARQQYPEEAPGRGERVGAAPTPSHAWGWVLRTASLLRRRVHFAVRLLACGHSSFRPPCRASAARSYTRTHSRTFASNHGHQQAGLYRCVQPGGVVWPHPPNAIDTHNSIQHTIQFRELTLAGASLTPGRALGSGDMCCDAAAAKESTRSIRALFTPRHVCVLLVHALVRCIS